MRLPIRLNQLGRIMSRGCLISLLSLLLCSSVNAEHSLSKEDKLKAAYLFNFTKFIEWPILAKSERPSSIRICVDGSSAFFEFLEELVANRRVGKLQKTVEVLSLETAGGCELLFVREGEKKITIQLDHTVIVADSVGTAFPNGALFFYVEQGKLRFEIDLEKINSLNVIVSSELLKLARFRS